jgi:hypothetical protein
MAVYVLIVIPSAWIIDTWGLRTAVGIGSALTAICALTRGIFASNFTLVLASQLGIAVGLGTLAIYIGLLTGMVATPALTIR